jgi:hypothetical protein
VISSNVRFGSLADILRCGSDVRFTPESGHSQAQNKCPLLTKPHSRSRKRLIGRLLNAAEYKRSKDCDGDCPNARKDEGAW